MVSSHASNGSFEKFDRLNGLRWRIVHCFAGSGFCLKFPIVDVMRLRAGLRLDVTFWLLYILFYYYYIINYILIKYAISLSGDHARLKLVS